MTHPEMAILWLISFFAGLTSITGRLGYMLFGIGKQPPTDPIELSHWRRKRRWLAISDLSALPAFATVSVAVTVYSNFPPVVSVLLTMIMGALGFGFLLNGLQFFIRRKLEMETTP
ncbi:hypothetical protein [Asticcacaulis endophyticus]|nr:hypothetical protein [Asticcacaulis endophyticus]